METNRIPLNLQFFNEEPPKDNPPAGGTPPADGATPPAGGAGEEKPPAKTFTQADVDRIVQERLARVKKAAELEEPKKPAPTQGDNGEIATVKKELYTAKLETALTSAGVDEKRLAKAMKLIDPADCLNENGYADPAKLKKAVTELLKEWPELKANAQETTEPTAKPKWGSPQNESGGKPLTAEEALRKAFNLK